MSRLPITRAVVVVVVPRLSVGRKQSEMRSQEIRTSVAGDTVADAQAPGTVGRGAQVASEGTTVTSFRFWPTSCAQGVDLC